MTERTPRITDQEARELWQRAVELQMAAEADSSAPRQLRAAGEAGMSLEQVIAAAEGAGIGPDYVRMAIAERRLPEANQLRRDRWQSRLHRILLRDDHAIDLSRPVHAPPDVTTTAFEAVVGKPAFHLVLEDRVGPDPPVDGVMVYRIENPGVSSSFHDAMDVSDARVVLVTARSDGERTVLRLRVPKFAHGQNLALTTGLVGGLGAGGGYGGAAAGTALAGVVGTTSLAVLAAPVAVGALIGAGLGLGGCRGVYRWGGRKGEEALRRLLQTVALEAESRSGTTPEDR